MPTPRPKVRTEPVYARAAADDAAGTACEAEVREALRLVEDTGSAALDTDARRSRLNANRPALLCPLADARRGGLRRAVVRDLPRLARSAGFLETTLGELRAARVELVTAGRTDWRA
jgi:DNA invertase Pin-like site-specific DNA recombinase